MYTVLVVAILSAPGQCPTCAPSDAAPMPPIAANGKVCRNYTPPVRWFCKPCAGCAGGVCQSCSQPWFGSQPYNYRIQFDYPWSQRPAYPLPPIMPPMDFTPDAEIIDLPAEARAAKPKQDVATRLKWAKTAKR